MINNKPKRIIQPQAGYQTAILSTSADIAIGGAAAGVGKTHGLLLEPTRYVSNPKFDANIFRRTSPQIRMSGGLWDASTEIYPYLKAKPRETRLQWKFPKGSKVSFNHLEHEKNLINYQGSEIPLIGFDELTHFSEKMFFYLLSRNRSTSGVKPYVRATCNPDPDSFVARLVAWYIDQIDIFPDGSINPQFGFPIAERVGKLRYFTKDGENIIWGNTYQEVYEKAQHIFNDPGLKDINPKDLIKSFTFIPGSIYDNKALLSKDAGYLANLLAQDEATKNSLFRGNWKVKQDNLSLYNDRKINDLISNTFADSGQPCMTADIAFEGSDLFIIWVWRGFRIVDVSIIEKSNAKEVETEINRLAYLHSVPQSHITYDSDGVGGFLRGYMPNAIPFVNNATAIIDEQEQAENYQHNRKPEQYKNLKTQCYYRSGKRVNNNEIYIEPAVANRIYKGKRVFDILKEQLRAVKKINNIKDGKLEITSKKIMIELLGVSPDFADAFMMREFLELTIKPERLVVLLN